MVVAQKTFIVNSEQARQQAERRFKRDEPLRDGRTATAEYEAKARAIRKKKRLVDRTTAEAQHGELYSGAAEDAHFQHRSSVCEDYSPELLVREAPSEIL